MNFFVYVLLSQIKDRYVTYVGYTNNIENRLDLHNSSKGAKFTKGKKWVLIYKKRYNSKSVAMREEFKLKNNKKKRTFIKTEYLKKI
jgi:putative endonuclease